MSLVLVLCMYVCMYMYKTIKLSLYLRLNRLMSVHIHNDLKMTLYIIYTIKYIIRLIHDYSVTH